MLGVAVLPFLPSTPSNRGGYMCMWCRDVHTCEVADFRGDQALNQRQDQLIPRFLFLFGCRGFWV